MPWWLTVVLFLGLLVVPFLALLASIILEDA
jgi:hypothetical protein